MVFGIIGAIVLGSMGVASMAILLRPSITKLETQFNIDNGPGASKALLWNPDYDITIQDRLFWKKAIISWGNKQMVYHGIFNNWNCQHKRKINLIHQVNYD